MAPRWPAVPLLVLSCLLLTAGQVRAGRLDDVERASGPSRSRSSGGSSQRSHESSTRGGASSSRSSGSSSWSSGGSTRQSSGSSASRGASESDGLFLTGLFYMLAFPIIVPHAFDEPCMRGYAAYPDRDGYFRTALWDEQCVAKGLTPTLSEPSTRAVVRKLAGNTGFEAGYGLGGLGGLGVTGALLLPRNFELGVRLQTIADFSERPTDQAIVSVSSVGFRIAQQARFAVRCGIGLRTFFLNERRLGPDAFYAVSVFGRHGMRWELEAHAGALSAAFAGQLRATFGIMLKRSELYAGYDYFHVRGPGGGATLQGPVLGLRVWL